MSVNEFMAVICYTITIFTLGCRVGSYINAKK